MRYPLNDEYRLRSWEEGDVEALVRAADNPRVARFLRDRFPQPYRRRDAVAWLEHVRTLEPETVFAIATRGEAVGSIGLHPQQDVYRCSAEIGYWLSEEHWGRGIAKLAVDAICEIGFSRSDLVRIYACVFEPNVASCRVLEKAGFTFEGIHRKAALKAGEFLNERMYALLREEWQERR